MLSELKDHQLFKEAITHHKLFGCSANVTVIVQNAHSCESCNVNLKSHMRSHLHINVGLLCREDTSSLSSAKIIESLVPNLVNHFTSFTWTMDCMEILL